MNSSSGRGLGVTIILLALALLALSVSVFGMARTTSMTNERIIEMQQAWQGLQDGTVNGSEMVATERLMSRVVTDAPLLQNATIWAAVLMALSFILLGCVVYVGRGLFHAKKSVLSARSSSNDSAITRLVDETVPIMDGDLRSSANESIESTSLLAKTFNHVVSDMRWLVGTLGSSAQQLDESIEKSRESAVQVSTACAEQSRQIHRSSNYLFSMSTTMSGLSADAVESSLAAQTAVEKAEAGGAALRASLHRLSAIRDEADGTTRVMHRLADNVASIDECVMVIKDVANQTDLLALNTTIRASAGSRAATVTDAAADLGRLSDEVAQLAEVLGQATRDIGSLTRIIAEDASDTVQSMEHITSELAAGVAQTQQASDALDVIQSSSQNLHESVLQMTERCVEQTGIVRQLTENMDEINQITVQTGDGVTLNSTSLDELQKLSVELRSYTSDFQMPESTVSTGTQKTSVSVARRAADRAVNV